jgi:protein SCO1
MKKLFAIIFLSIAVSAAQDRIQIGIDEQLGSKIPMDLTFIDEGGNKVALKDLITIPTVFTFVYFNCPGICTPLMTELAEVLNEVDMKPLEQFRVISLSIDETEDHKLAASKKKNYIRLIERDFDPEGWKFLTGDSASIYSLTDAAGFYFIKEGKDFVHSGALIFVTADGTITRYLFPNYSTRHSTFSILPFDFKMAVIETSKGRLVPTIATMLKFCFSYDPEGKSYALNITRISGAIILFAALVFVLFITIKPKKKVNKGS